MNCEKTVATFLALDNGASIPLSVRFHIFHCRRCRNELFALRKTFDSLKKKAPYKAPAGFAECVMHRIEFLEMDYERNISNMKWFISGFVIFASIFIISFSDWVGWIISHTGDFYGTALYLFMGVGLTVYAVCFIGTHLVYLKKLSDRVVEYEWRHGKA